MNKARKFAIAALTAAFALTCAGTGIVSFADESPVTPNTVPDQEWSGAWCSGTFTYNLDDGYSKIEAVWTFGNRSQYAYSVHLDGLTVSFLEGDSMKVRDMACFYFIPGADKYWSEGSAITFAMWKNETGDKVSPAEEQPTDVYVASNHDPANKDKVMYTDETLQTVHSDKDGNRIFSFDGKQRGGASYAFKKVSDAAWRLTITKLIGATANSYADSVTYYFPASYLNGVINEDGTTNIHTGGFVSTGSGANNDHYIKLEDSVYQPAVDAAQTALEAYETAAAGVSDLAGYESAMTVRDTLLSKIAVLHSNDKARFNAKLAAADAKMQTVAAAQTAVREGVQKSYTAADEALAVLEDDETLTQETYGAATEAVNGAKAAFDNASNMLTEDNRSYFAELNEDYSYKLNLYSVRLWIVEFEQQVTELEASTNQVEDLVEIKALRATYEETYGELLAALHEEDSEALGEKLAAADARVAEVEKMNSGDVKDNYLTKFEKTLEEDITDFALLDAAKAAYLDLMAKVSITDADTELYPRFTAAYGKLKKGIEDYESAEIAAVDAALGEDIVKYSVFKPVRDRFEAIDLTYLLEENAAVESAYNAVKPKLEGHKLYYVGGQRWQGSTDPYEVELTENGLYYESEGTFPGHFNWNKPLNLAKKGGATVVIELTECAFYNDGTFANNFVFQFSPRPDMFKNNDNEGLTIVSWVFATEMSIDVVKSTTDTTVAGATKKTMPVVPDGGTITINIEKRMYTEGLFDAFEAYVVTINGIVVPVPVASFETEGITVTDECYFSLGTFVDHVKGDLVNPLDGPNCFTIRSFDGEFVGIGEGPVDRENPTVSITTPTTAKAGDEITVAFTARDNETAASDLKTSVSVKKDGKDVTLKNNKFTAEEGTYTVTVTAEDAAGNKGSATITITVSKAEEKPDDQKPDDQKPDDQKPDDQKPDDQNPDDGKQDDDKKGCFGVIGWGAGAFLSVLLVAATLVVLRKRTEK